MLKHDIGVLSATTAFGKTVIAAKLIAERKVSTLVLTHRTQLLSQWTAKLSEFLEIDEALPIVEKKRGRKKKQSLIGQIGAGKSRPSGIIDVAIMQSLNSGDEAKELVKNYGMVIVDECHHVPAFSFEQILKGVHAKYVVYGLTATPTRQDGRHPIIFMHCGPIRYRVDARKQAEKRPFEHYVIPRLTSFRAPLEEEGKEPSIQRLYAAIAVSEPRNQRIVEDVVRCFQSGGNALVLTERTAHVALLAAKLREQIPRRDCADRRQGGERDARAGSVDKGFRSACRKAVDADCDREIHRRGIRRAPPGYAFSGHAHLMEGNAPTIRGQAPPSLFKSNIHQKFAIFDQKIVWYGSINLLSFGRSEESIMRLDNPGIADELLGSI